MKTMQNRLEMLRKRQKETYDAMCSCLAEHGMCCVVRPTGFGKTKLFMDYARNNIGSRILYVYDTTSAKVDIIKSYAPSNVEFISYSALSRGSRHDSVVRSLCSQPYHTIIFDEAHLMGGRNIKKVLSVIIPLAVAAGVSILGGTATNLRTDLIDVSKFFFCGHETYEYTLLDAVRDGIMLEPFWTVTAHYKTLLESLKRYEKSNSFVKSQITQLTKAYAHIDGVSSVYRDSVERVYGNIPDIMRFIVFYPTIKAIDDNFQRDIKEFGKAFPDHAVRYGILSSSPNHMSTVTEVEESFTDTGKQVQLIFSVNMLNQSYHSEKLTGIVMYRSTLSNIIFTQELGRVMSVTSKFRGIVFDNVGNVFMKPESIMGMPLSNSVSKSSGSRTHINLQVSASNELIEFQRVYKRIISTCEITQAQLDAAKRNWERHKRHMSWEDFEAITKMPRYVIEG